MSVRVSPCRCALCIPFCIAACFAADIRPIHIPPHTVSMSGRFTVYGSNRLDTVTWADWLEKVCGRLEERLGMTVPFASNSRLSLYLRDDDAPADRILREQMYVMGLLQQRVRVRNMLFTERDDVLEVVCGLLLDRFIQTETPRVEGRDELRHMPDWFAVGVARSLYPGYRHRNNRVAIDRWRTGALPSLKQMFLMESIPPEMKEDKIMAAVMVDWLLNGAAEKTWLKALFGKRSRGLFFTVCDVLPFTDAAEVRDIEQQWWVHVGRLQHVRTHREPVTESLLKELAEYLMVVPGYAEEAPAELRTPMRPVALIACKHEPWLQHAVAWNIARLNMLRVGRHPAFSKTVEKYIHFLLTVSDPDTPKSDDELYEMVSDADEQFAKLSVFIE